MATALVTGANGFIGSHLVRALATRGYAVRGLVRQTSDLTSLAGVPVDLHVGDLREPATLAVAATGVDLVFHLGAELMVTSRADFLATNAEGTANLLHAVAAGSPGLQRFVLVSSQAAAGPGADARPRDETATPAPISWYGESKCRAEEIARGYVGRLPVTIVRPSSVYGEGERDISQIFASVSCRLQPRLGWRRRHVVMVYVGDLVEGIIAAALSAASVGETYFMNHRDVMTTAQVTSSIARAMGKAAGLPLPAPTVLLRLAAPLAEAAYHFTRNRPPITRDKAREVSQLNWVADSGKAQRDFGWTARQNLVAGMTPTVQAWAATERDLIAATGESSRGAWFKTVVIATLLGAGIEISSKLGGFYAFDPPAGVFAAVFGAFGLAFGSLAHALRRWCPLAKFLVGWVVAGGLEAANLAGLVPGLSWTFAPGWPLGIDSDLWRTVVLGSAGGVFILVVEAIMTALYRRRRRLG